MRAQRDQHLLVRFGEILGIGAVGQADIAAPAAGFGNIHAQLIGDAIRLHDLAEEAIVLKLFVRNHFAQREYIARLGQCVRQRIMIAQFGMDLVHQPGFLFRDRGGRAPDDQRRSALSAHAQRDGRAGAAHAAAQGLEKSLPGLRFQRALIDQGHQFIDFRQRFHAPHRFRFIPYASCCDPGLGPCGASPCHPRIGVVNWTPAFHADTNGN